MSHDAPVYVVSAEHPTREATWLTVAHGCGKIAGAGAFEDGDGRVYMIHEADLRAALAHLIPVRHG